MLFGMGMTLTAEEDEQLAGVIRPCYAALGLANDYFSFDREYKEFRSSSSTVLTNAVWLFMKWHEVDIGTAKTMVRKATNIYERDFRDRCTSFRKEHQPISAKLD
jgi:hypothetical protein